MKSLQGRSHPRTASWKSSAFSRGVERLHQLLDATRRSEVRFVVTNVVVLGQQHHLIGYVPDAFFSRTFNEASVIRCKPGSCRAAAGMRLRLWRDETGAHLQHCIP